ncbi:MAG: membrane-bound lytic murein transglycosylase MltF, partial [Pseudomonadales bacterium]|nr:membrane-bound lytic murein transglycosylase MltF [Pseudomonadales bacterium]
FSPAYTLSNTRFYYRYGNGMPRSWEDVKGRDILISSHSHHEELLLSMKQQYPWLKWRVDREHKPYQLMQLVQNEQADLIVLDSNTFLLNQGLFPKVRPALQIGKEKPMAWAVTKNHDLSFYHAIAHYFSLIEEDGTLDNLKDIYFEHMSAMNSGGSNMFYQRIKTRLPRYEALFKKAADDFQLDWHLLAAMSYQESFWNPKAVSPTGVRGLMMLTRSTAGSLGISDRSDPEQSVMGGAAYFSSIREQLDSNIAEPDRTWLALAAYNAGLGHLEDARTLTQRYGGDPKKWADVKKHFPFLMQKTHYSTVKYGYARGEETVNYVQRIRQYYSILTWRSRMQVFTGR